MKEFLLAVLIVAAFVIDVRHSKIPNWLTLGGAGFGLLFHFAMQGVGGLVSSAAGLAVGFLVLLLLYAFGALGAGDVKLFAAIGAICGSYFVLCSILYSLMFAGAIGLLIVMWRKEAIRRIGAVFRTLLFFALLRDRDAFRRLRQEDILRFPFMYAVVPGVLTAFYYTMT
jgi:prepilin peptidase CpaA